MNHLPVLPIVLPLLVGAVLLLIQRFGIGAQRALALTALLAQVLVAALLLEAASDGSVSVYLAGDWPARLGIALALDRLAAIMIATTAVLALGCGLFASAGWDQRAPHFHALLQFQLMGLNGAFLTADLFNLFVFFEVLLIASYGLMLSGGRGSRMRAGLHYVVFNVMASTLFLVALGLLYGLLGALNMAEMAQRVAAASAADLPLIQAAGGILLVVFCAKAALLPMYLWLPETYSRSPAAVAALFTIMTKLGVYAVLRVYSLIFGDGSGDLAGFAWPWLLAAGAVTLALASFGALASLSLRRMISWLVVASAATLFIAVGLASVASVTAGLYYLVQSSLVTAGLYLLADLIRRRRIEGDRICVGTAFAQRGWLGGLFVVATVAVVGLPPLSGFIGKFTLMAAVPDAQALWLWPLILLSSLMLLVAMARAGSTLFWRSTHVRGRPAEPELHHDAPPLSRLQVTAVLLMLGGSVVLSVAAAPALRYAEAAALQLASPATYQRALLNAPTLDPLEEIR